MPPEPKREEPKTDEYKQAKPSRPLRVVFVCQGNACRSQMAEAWTRHYARGRVKVQSAGLHPLGEITEDTLTVMSERGISLDGQESKGLEAIDWQEVDVLVNMAAWPTASLAPSFLGRRMQWNVRDPFGESLEVYRKVRDELEWRVRTLVEELTS